MKHGIVDHHFCWVPIPFHWTAFDIQWCYCLIFHVQIINVVKYLAHCEICGCMLYLVSRYRWWASYKDPWNNLSVHIIRSCCRYILEYCTYYIYIYILEIPDLGRILYSLTFNVDAITRFSITILILSVNCWELSAYRLTNPIELKSAA